LSGLQHISGEIDGNVDVLLCLTFAPYAFSWNLFLLTSIMNNKNSIRNMKNALMDEKCGFSEWKLGIFR